MSSNGASTPGGNTGWSAGKVILVLALTSVAVYFAVPPVKQHFQPDSERGIRLIDTLADKHEVAKVKQAEPVLLKTVGGDDRTFGNGLKNFGSADHLRANDREAAKARALGTSESHVEAAVTGDQHGVNWVAEAYEDLHVWTDPTVKMTLKVDPSVLVTADGREVTDVEWRNKTYLTDETMLMAARLDPMRTQSNRHFLWLGSDCRDGVCDATVEQVYDGKQYRVHDAGKLYELAGQVCTKSGNCTELHSMGSDAYVCGQFGGQLLMGPNRRAWVDNEPNDSSKYNLDGKWKINVEHGDPRAQEECAKHPGLTIIKLARTALVTPTGLITGPDKN